MIRLFSNQYPLFKIFSMSPNFKRINKKLLHKNIFMPTVSSIDNYEFIFQNILDIFHQEAER